MGQGIFQQQRNGLYAVNISSPGGVFDVKKLTELVNLTKQLNVYNIKCGTRQTLIILLEKDKVDKFVEGVQTLGLKICPFGSTIRSIKACAGGEGLCPRMLGDALDLGMKLEEKYMGQPTPKDFKISTAGCPRGCTEPYCTDFGVVATGKDNYKVIIGGRGSTVNPIHGSLIAENVSREKIFTILDFVLNKYIELGDTGERLCKTIERVGVKEFTPPKDVYASENSVAVDEDFANFLLAD